ncbi:MULTISPECIES: RNA 2',3'-cyclic phosphodiesterase [unclassified Devosia]|uniref:RNA 2',3'-cyclic phosphodiesterase n=1 Tax=unclassified Devosia TaxID=196773 RepID=UPI00145E139E|nr:MULTISPECIES: RNA 2',3'-cyclic phosphodiesterase [unclassified Devosia]MBK1795601.1 RNA 2',3'-cyclic phosphodiesterase [Devosia sp. WQ 349K1]
MPRLFTGIEIPRDIGFALSLKRGGLHGARWIEPSDYHITLRFIGDVDAPTANDIVDNLERLSKTVRFDLRLTQIDSFGGDKPRALYAAVEPSDGLNRLQAAHERVIQQAGIAPEGRKFVPHVTLARLRGASSDDVARFLSEAPVFEPLRFTPTQFVLYSSRDSVGGGPYVVEESFPLSAQT